MAAGVEEAGDESEGTEPLFNVKELGLHAREELTNPVRLADGAHVAADLDEQHGGTDGVDTRQGLQHGQRICVLALQLVEQTSVESGDARCEFLDVPHQFVENDQVTRGQFAQQGVVQRLTVGLETSAGERQVSYGACTWMMLLIIERADWP